MIEVDIVNQNYGHNTEYCYQLKEIIESLKWKGLLAEFMKDEPQRDLQLLKEKEKVIDVILNETPSMVQLKWQIHFLKRIVRCSDPTLLQRERRYHFFHKGRVSAYKGKEAKSTYFGCVDDSPKFSTIPDTISFGRLRSII